MKFRKIITTISKNGNFRRRYMLIWCPLSSGPPTNIGITLISMRVIWTYSWGQGPPSFHSLSFPFLSPPSTLSPPLFLPSLRIGPLVAASGSSLQGTALALPAGPGRAGRQTVFGEFPAENLAFSSNDLQEFCGKWNIKVWGDWSRVVTYLCKQTVWTSKWHGRCLARMWRHVWEWVVLHCTFLSGLWGPLAPANDAPAYILTN